MSNDFPSIFDLEINRLSDILIPLREDLKLVSLVEGCSDYSITLYKKNMQGATEDITDQMYIFPYPYLEPISKEFASIHMDINAVSEKDYTEWKNRIDERFTPLVNFAIPYEKMRQIDNDPDTGCIVHITTGYIVPFTYSKIDGLEILSTPVNYETILEYLAKVNEIPDANFALFKESKEHIYDLVMSSMVYRRHYKFKYTGHDPWNPQDEQLIPATASSRGLLTQDQLDTANNHILEGYNQHKKVIVTI